MIWTDRSFDRETRTQYQFYVTASNKRDAASSATATVAVRVLDDNDEAPHFTQRRYVFHVPENRPAGSTVGHVAAVDRDLAPNDRYGYYVDAAAGDVAAGALLGVERRTGRVYTRRPLDREVAAQILLGLTVRDDVIATLHDSATIVVQVGDDNDETPVFRFPTASNDTAHVRRPVFQFPSVSNDTAYAPADIRPGGRVARVAAVDADKGDNAVLHYSIDAGQFKRHRQMKNDASNDNELFEPLLTRRATA